MSKHTYLEVAPDLLVPFSTLMAIQGQWRSPDRVLSFAWSRHLVWRPKPSVTNISLDENTFQILNSPCLSESVVTLLSLKILISATTIMVFLKGGISNSDWELFGGWRVNYNRPEKEVHELMPAHDKLVVSLSVILSLAKGGLLSRWTTALACTGPSSNRN